MSRKSIVFQESWSLTRLIKAYFASVSVVVLMLCLTCVTSHLLISASVTGVHHLWPLHDPPGASAKETALPAHHVLCGRPSPQARQSEWQPCCLCTTICPYIWSWHPHVLIWSWHPHVLIWSWQPYVLIWSWQPLCKWGTSWQYRNSYAFHTWVDCCVFHDKCLPLVAVHATTGQGRDGGAAEGSSVPQDVCPPQRC